MAGLIIIAAILLLVLFFVVATYNSLVSLKNHIKDSWSNIDTELKRRYELIPNLVATVKGYAAHEREVFEQITKLRAQCIASNGLVSDQSADERQLEIGRASCRERV